MREESLIVTPASNDTYESKRLDRFTALIVTAEDSNCFNRGVPLTLPPLPSADLSPMGRGGTATLRRIPASPHRGEGGPKGRMRGFSKISGAETKKPAAGGGAAGFRNSEQRLGGGVPLLYFQALREERRPEARSGREEVPRFNEFKIPNPAVVASADIASQPCKCCIATKKCPAINLRRFAPVPRRKCRSPMNECVPASVFTPVNLWQQRGLRRNSTERRRAGNLVRRRSFS